RESARTNNVLVVIKLLVLGLFIVAGLTHIHTENYTPLTPNGWRGIHQGAAIVFFAYIGFDAISTAAEETKNPQRNLPIGILGGLAICTVIYVIVGAVLTGMVKYSDLGVGVGRRRQRDLQPDQHRDAVRLRARVRRRLRAALYRAGPATSVPGAVVLGDDDRFGGAVHLRDEGSTARNVGALRRLAGNRV